MRWNDNKVLRFPASLIILLLSSVLAPLAQSAQTAADDSYQVEKQRAMILSNQDKRLEALPLFEDLANKNPKDSDVLVALAECLVDKSATIEDQQEAAKIRVRARGLLLEAKELGNNSTILQNLLQLLPEDGVIQYKDNPADRAMQKAEAAFARRDFDEAISNYLKVLEADPKNYSATLYIGDSYFAAKNFPKAAEWYQKAIDADPNQETAYRYYADMLTKSGDMEKARTKAIQAVVAEPYNPITWRGLEQWAKSNHLELNRVHVVVPNSVSQKDEKNITITVDAGQTTDTSAVWLIYSMVQAKWRGDEFKKHFPDEKQYRHSLAEESEALTKAAQVLTELESQKKSSTLAKDQNLALLLKIREAGLIDPYVLLSAPDDGIAQDYNPYRAQHRDKLEEYLSQFVVPPAPE